MKKNYLQWHDFKSEINQKKNISKFFKEREVWYFACGLNVGYEQDGKGKFFSRPVLILKKFSKNLFWGIPLTSRSKNYWFYYECHFKENQKSWAILSQLRAFDSKRLLKKIGKLNVRDFILIKEKVSQLLN